MLVIFHQWASRFGRGSTHRPLPGRHKASFAQVRGGAHAGPMAREIDLRVAYQPGPGRRLEAAAADHLFRQGQLVFWGVPSTGVLVETLLDRGDESDVAEAQAVIARLAAAPAEEGLVIRDIWLLRLRALLAQTHSDATAYAHFRDAYRDMATSLGYEGHIAWAEAMR